MYVLCRPVHDADCQACSTVVIWQNPRHFFVEREGEYIEKWACMVETDGIPCKVERTRLCDLSLHIVLDHINAMRLCLCFQKKFKRACMQ